MRARLLSSTSYPIPFFLTDALDGITGKTGLTPTVTIRKVGGSFGAPSGAVTEIANGWYELAGNATDRNTLGPLLVHATATGAQPFDGEFTIVGFDPFDAVALGLSRLDAAVSSRSSHVAADVWSVTTRAITDKAGFSLSSAGIQAIWDALTSALTTVGSIGKRLSDDIDATVSSRSSHSAADVWASATRTLSAFAFSVTVGTNNDKTGYGLSGAAIQAIWDALTSALTTAGSIGKRLADDVDATISSRSSHTAADIWTAGTRTLTAFSFAVDLSAGAVTAVWDKATSALTTAGSIGKLLVDNVNATISSRLATAGYTAPDNASITTILGRTDVATSTRLATSGYTAPDNAGIATISAAVDTEVAGIKAKTDNLPASPAAVSDIPTAATIAAAVWDRATSALSVAGSIGKRLADNVDVVLSTRSSHTAADVWAATTRTLSAFAFGVTVTTNSDKTGYALSPAGVQAVWDALTSALSTVGSVGKLLADNLNATISSRLPTASYVAPDNADIATILTRTDVATSTRLATAGYTAPDNANIGTIAAAVDTEVAAIKARTDLIPNSPAAVSDIPSAAAIAAAVWAAGSRTLTSFGTLAADVWASVSRTLTSGGGASAAEVAAEVWAAVSRTLTSASGSTPEEVADAVWDAATRSLTEAPDVPSAAEITAAVWSEPVPGAYASGSAGRRLTTIADPLTNLVPGAYASGTAGRILGSLDPGRLTAVTPAVSLDGGTVTIVRGDDYAATDGRALDWTDTGSRWPDLAGATVVFTARFGPAVLGPITATILTPSGANKKIRVELTSAQTTPLPIRVGSFDVQATLVTSARVVTLVRGKITVLEDQTYAV